MNSWNISRTEKKKTNIDHQSKWFKELAYPRTSSVQPPQEHSHLAENSIQKTDNQKTIVNKTDHTTKDTTDNIHEISLNERLAYLNIESVSHFTRNISAQITTPYTPYRTHSLTNYFAFSPMNQEKFMSKRCYRVNARADKWLKTKSQSNEQYTMTLGDLLKATEDLYRERKRIISTEATYNFLYRR